MILRSRGSETKLSLPDHGHAQVVLRRNVRARRLSLRVSQLDGKVTLTAPILASEQNILEFLHDHDGWLQKALCKIKPAVLIGAGVTLPIRGVLHRVQHLHTSHRPTYVAAPDLINVSCPPSRIAVKVAVFLKEIARADLSAQIPDLALQIGKTAGNLTLRDTRSRWGSCTQAGALMFSWRLIMAPPEVLRYVAAHEVAHLRHMDHSRAFWATVTELMPDYEAPRQWLRRHGAELHQYQFK